MNRRELLLGTIAIAVAPALPAVEEQTILCTQGPWLLDNESGPGQFVLRYVINQSPDSKWLASNDDFAMAS